MTRFYEIEPTAENYWRAIILFGRNVASYKFALAKSLYDLRDSANDLVTLDEIAPAFAGHIVQHLKRCDKQATSASSKFLEACKAFNNGEINQTKLVDEARKRGFANVIDAFHNVHGEEIAERFFVDERRENKGIRLTDYFYSLVECSAFDDLNVETEARWRLVETAWELGVSRHVVQVACDTSNDCLHTLRPDRRRVDITSARDALNGYQKGRCFYCYRDISVLVESDLLADVDHFFPHMLKFCADGRPIDGVANLVLACKDCNRGVNGKFDRIPDIAYLERLNHRNEYLIKSHHPLSETLRLQTGLTKTDRIGFLQQAYNCAKEHVITTWRPEVCGVTTF